MNYLKILILGLILGFAAGNAPATQPTLKTYSVTYRVDEGNKRGTPQKTTVNAVDSADAKKVFRENNPKAIIIAVSEFRR